ncbi:glutamate receptor ionotropic, kainate glr-3-like [Haliotis rubra]|uniref:glutamate receptor ionotropic, kainate glr-3-like n=1 Tax=Haliotis rubra TaxID=36100 RepID=UPI001EE59548|nr:glutamate receptor ionotropic, kainate glr-3-like [Haliotis rubra]
MTFILCIQSHRECCLVFKDSRCQKVFIYTIHNTMAEHRFLEVPTLLYTETNLFPNMKYGHNKRTLVVSTLPSLGMLEMDVVDNRISISGPIADILQILAKTLNFSYIIRPPADKQWGLEVDGVWNGMVGQLQRKEVDLVAADLSVHEDRIAVMDFIMPPIMYSYVEVMYKKVDDDANQWLLLAKPFKLEVFLLIFACGILFSILYRITQSRSNFEFSNYRYWYEMLWFTLSTILKQVTDKPSCEKRQEPVSYGSKLLLGFWLLFLIVIVSIYTASFVAAISVKKEKPPFANLMELVEREDYTLGMPIEGVNYDLFKTSPREDVQKAWRRMKKENETNPFIMSTDYDAHARKVETGKHAAFMYTSQIQKYQQEDCRLATLQDKVSWQQSAFGIPLQSPLKDDLENVMSFLVQSGIIQNILNRRKWSSGHNNTCIQDKSAKAIVIKDLLGCVVVVSVCLGLSLLALILELLFNKRFHKCKPASIPSTTRM